MAELEFVTDGMFRPDVVVRIDGKEHLVGSKCRSCGDVKFPPALGCPVCNGPAADMEPSPLSRTGVVAAATRVERAIPPFVPPYLLAYINLPERVRVLCQLRSTSLEPATVIGRDCELVLGELYRKDGEAVRGFRFEVKS